MKKRKKYIILENLDFKMDLDQVNMIFLQVKIKN